MACLIPMPLCVRRCCGRFSTARAERKIMGRLLAAVAALAIGAFAAPGLAQDKLALWWTKGIYKAEDDALLAVARKYQARTGVHVELTWHAEQAMISKVMAALDAGAPPDIAYADAFNLQTAGRWAF